MKLGKTITFSIPEASILLNVWQRKHWTQRKKYHEELYWKVRKALREAGHTPSVPMQVCRIEADRFSAQLADWDGVMGGLKPLLDCLVKRTDKNPLGLGLIEDDNPKCVIECPTVRQHKSKRKDASTTVKNTEILEA